MKAASPLRLFAEEFDAETGRHLGNFPQAFSHLALVEDAARIIVAEGLAEVTELSSAFVQLVSGAAAQDAM